MVERNQNKRRNYKDTVKLQASEKEVDAYQGLVRSLHTALIPDNQILAHLPLFLTRVTVSHLLFISDLYRNILSVHGDILEFGCRWGRNLALFLSLRNILEPHNYTRKVIGFDTFEGFVSKTQEDGNDSIIESGNLAVAAGWENSLFQLLTYHENLAPRSELRRFNLIKGDVTDTFSKWLEEHPESLVALAYFDMDLYLPTKAALQALLPRLTKGAVIGFDELCLEAFPGETLALREILDLRRHRIIRSVYSGNQSYIIWD